MIDVDDLYLRCIDAAQTAVGASLTQLDDGAGGNIGAVFDSRKGRPTGLYPFLVVDVVTRQKQQSWAQDVYQEDNGDLVTNIAYDYIISYAVYGGNAMEISGELESSFVRQDIQELFTVDGFGAVTDTFPSASEVFQKSNSSHQFASFLLKVGIVDKVVETTNEITTINNTLVGRYNPSDVDVITLDQTTSNP